MPTNLGPGDNYEGENSHVLPALIRRFHEAKEAGLLEVEIWGTGKPRRELMHVDDLASGVLFLLQIEEPPDWVNLDRSGSFDSEIAELVRTRLGMKEDLNDTTRPDGMPVKRLDVLANSLGWKSEIPFEDGISSAYADFLAGLETGTTRV